MYLFESFIFDVSQGIRLVPSIGEDVEGNLSSDGIRESVIRELFLQRVDKCRTEAVLLNRSQQISWRSKRVVTLS